MTEQYASEEVWEGIQDLFNRTQMIGGSRSLLNDSIVLNMNQLCYCGNFAQSIANNTDTLNDRQTCWFNSIFMNAAKIYNALMEIQELGNAHLNEELEQIFKEFDGTPPLSILLCGVMSDFQGAFGRRGFIQLQALNELHQQLLEIGKADAKYGVMNTLRSARIYFVVCF